MKIAFRIVSLLVLAAMSAFYVGCKGDGDPEVSATDKQIALLAGTWATDNNSVTFEGTAQSLDYSNFKLTISGTPGSNILSYVITGRPAGPSPWQPNGTLTFGTDVEHSLTREDDIAVTYTVDATTLTMDFTFDKEQAYSSTGKAKSVGGDWKFVFTKAQ